MRKFIRAIFYFLRLFIWIPRRAFDSLWSARSCGSYQAFSSFFDHPGFMRKGKAFRFVLDDFFDSVGAFESGLNVGSGHFFIEGLRSVDLIFGHSVYCMPFENDSQDVVFCSHCLEHVDSEDRLFSEIKRVLKPGGLAYFYVPHEACEMWAPKNLSFHHRVYSASSLRNACERNNFVVKKIDSRPDVYLSLACLVQVTK